MSLRARLIGALVVLATLGLVAANVATYVELRSFLLARVDQSLTGSARVLTRTIILRGFPDGHDLGALAALAPGTYLEIRAPDGSVVGRGFLAPSSETPARPRIPSKLPGLAQLTDPDSSRYLDVGAIGAGTRFRARISPLPSGAALVVAQSLSSVHGTLNRLALIELIVSLSVLAILGLLARWLVRLGLRPLNAIEGTAAKIAAGDLSQRVAHDEPRTEVGRLGGSLNAMLGQIEEAFAKQRASEERLRRFVGDASHELRTPLSAIKAYAELFERGAKARPDDLARAMSGIENEARRMGVLVDDLLLLARLDRGRPLERKEVDLTDLAHEAVEAARTVDPGRPIALETNGPLVVEGDPLRLRQVLDNLLANVRAHTPAGTQATVAVRRDDDRALLEVRDAGPGLEPAELEHAFERFYRGDPSRSRQSGGAGLGLSIVKAIVEAHGGTVAAASQPGAGATFAIALPQRRSTADRPEEEGATDGEGSGQPPAGVPPAG